jgi:HPt (histidine-containing phosphotransfer) domain-containing protein
MLGDRQLAAQIASTFLSGHQADLDALANALVRDDLAASLVALDVIQGVAANIGAPRLQSVCTKLRHEASSASLREHFSQIEAACREVCTGIHKAFPSLRPARD